MVAARLNVLSGGQRAAGVRERIVFRNPVWHLATVDIDAEDLAVELAQILGIVEWVAGRAAVTDRDVEHAVGAEGDRAAVMVEVGIRDLEQDPRGGWIGLVGIVR